MSEHFEVVGNAIEKAIPDTPHIKLGSSGGPIMVDPTN
jgi:hypothetical protein